MSRRALIILLPLLLTATAQGSPLNYDIDTGVPPLLHDTRPQECTITYLVEDIRTNDTYAARMRFSPSPSAAAANGRLPCPTMVPQRINDRALDQCRARATDVKDCAFADMGRGFAADPQHGEASAGASRCASDLASQIGVACWNTGRFDVCSVACGQTVPEAKQAARNRCEAKHGKRCAIIGSLPVLAQ